MPKTCLVCDSWTLYVLVAQRFRQNLRVVVSDGKKKKADSEDLTLPKKAQTHWPVQVSPIQPKRSQKMALCTQNGEELETFGEHC